MPTASQSFRTCLHGFAFFFLLISRRSSVIGPTSSSVICGPFGDVFTGSPAHSLVVLQGFLAVGGPVTATVTNRIPAVARLVGHAVTAGAVTAAPAEIVCVARSHLSHRLSRRVTKWCSAGKSSYIYFRQVGIHSPFLYPIAAPQSPRRQRVSLATGQSSRHRRRPLRQ